MLQRQGSWIVSLVASKARLAAKRMAATVSYSATTMDLSCVVAGREEGDPIETTDSGSPQACGVSGGRNGDITGHDMKGMKGMIDKENMWKYMRVKYLPGCFNSFCGERRVEYAINALCLTQEDLNTAEVEYDARQSTTYLMNY